MRHNTFVLCFLMICGLCSASFSYTFRIQTSKSSNDASDITQGYDNIVPPFGINFNGVINTTTNSSIGTAIVDNEIFLTHILEPNSTTNVTDFSYPFALEIIDVDNPVSLFTTSTRGPCGGDLLMGKVNASQLIVSYTSDITNNFTNALFNLDFTIELTDNIEIKQNSNQQFKSFFPSTSSYLVFQVPDSTNTANMFNATLHFSVPDTPFPFNEISLAGGKQCPDNMNAINWKPSSNSNNFTTSISNLQSGWWYLGLQSTGAETKAIIYVAQIDIIENGMGICNTVTGFCSMNSTSDNNSGGNNSKTRNEIIIICSVIGGVVIIVIITACVGFCAYRKMKSVKEERHRLLNHS